MKRELVLGNGAIARGIIESGAAVATAYPGTPSTEILEEIVRFKKAEALDIYTEWSVNEKVAFDVALAASIRGHRSATAMKMVGLNVASDSLLSAAYLGVKGGMVVVPCDDPGPYSSQTEQDSRLFSIFAKIPVLDPSTPREARDMVGYAFELSERHELPVIIRATTRICHARQPIDLRQPIAPKTPERFKKDPHRWAATPRHRLTLHGLLNEKLAKICDEFEAETPWTKVLDEDVSSRAGIIASGAVFAVARDLLEELGLKVPILKLGTVYPLPLRRVTAFIEGFEEILVLEEPDAAIEYQIPDRQRVRGRLDGTVPPQGELLPDVVREVLGKVLPGVESPPPSLQVERVVEPPRLCPGCGHRPAFYSMRKAFPRAIYPGDIGCYTLGMNTRAVDTCIAMGASITVASGFYHAMKREGLEKIEIVATIGDSTFFHAGIPALLNAHVTDARFVLLILDNDIVAMTGFQPTPATGRQADGREVPSTTIRQVVEGLGIEFIEEIDPYETDDLIGLIKRGHEHTRQPDGGVAVIIARRPCVLRSTPGRSTPAEIVPDNCDGCQICLKLFGCPSLLWNADTEKVEIEHRTCVECGICIAVCPNEAIVKAEDAAP
jgi:indolepyruvate ferredoxin oxidoreductase alpha subunit